MAADELDSSGTSNQNARDRSAAGRRELRDEDAGQFHEAPRRFARRLIVAADLPPQAVGGLDGRRLTQGVLLVDLRSKLDELFADLRLYLSQLGGHLFQLRSVLLRSQGDAA